MKTQNRQINPRKKEAVSNLKKTLKSFEDVVFFDYRGFSTLDLTRMRILLNEKGAIIKIIKNNILLRSFDKPELKNVFKNPTAIIFCPKETASSVTKIVFSFLKENKKNSSETLKGALADSVVWSASQMDAFSKLPSRIELIAQFVRLSKEITTRFARSLNAIAEKQEA